MILPVPHYQQAYNYTCVPACARMILAYFGHEHDEAELALTFKTIPFLGTQPDQVVSGLETLGYHALWFENATIERMKDILAVEWPLIVFLRAQDLPHGRTRLHALVIIGIEDDAIVCLDPTLADRLKISPSSFVSLWANLNYQGMVIWE